MRRLTIPWPGFCVLLLALFSYLCFTVSTAATAGTVSTTTQEGRLAVFDDVWETISSHYYDPGFNGVNWTLQREAFRPLAAQAPEGGDLYKVLRRMIGALGDAHTRVYAPEERFDWQHPRAIGIGISVADVAGAPTVTAVNRGSEAERKGIRPGDVILSIDGESAPALIDRRLREQVRSSTIMAARSRAMSTLFEGGQGSEVQVVWKGARGRQKCARLTREWRERDPSVRFQSRHEGYYVVELTAFTPDTAGEFTRRMSRNAGKLRGLVLDLRDNGGGEAQSMVEIASSFLPEGTNLGKFLDRAGHAIFEPTTSDSLLSSPQVAPANRNLPIVILTNVRTSSAAEIFAEAMRNAHRASIIGARTCGCVLAIRHRHTLPDGGELDVSEMDYVTAEGKRLEGVGVTPDEIVNVEPGDLRGGLDRPIERALERLKECYIYQE